MSLLVDRQLGHITRAQLLALGVTPAWIRSRIRRGWLVPVHAEVYAVGHVPRHAHARAMAAVLACGEGAALSHCAAAALWGAREWPAVLEVVAPGEHRRPGIWTHRSSTLAPRVIVNRHGIPVTSPARTVIDLEHRLNDPGLIRLVDDLRIAGHLRPSALATLISASARVSRLLGDDLVLTRSVLEDLFRAFVTRHDIPMPEINARLPGNDREADTIRRILAR